MHSIFFNTSQKIWLVVVETSNRETKHHTWGVRELRFITLVGLEELTLQALSPKQRGYRVFIQGQALLSGFAGLQGLGDCKEQNKSKWDKLQFLVLWVPTFWNLPDPDFARRKLSYRGRTSRRLCKILTFPLQALLNSISFSQIPCFSSIGNNRTSIIGIHSLLITTTASSPKGIFVWSALLRFMEIMKENQNWRKKRKVKLFFKIKFSQIVAF